MAHPLNHIAQVVTDSGAHVGMATLVQAEERILITCAHVVRSALGKETFDPHSANESAIVRLRWPRDPGANAWATVLEEGWTSSDEVGGDLAVLQLGSDLPDDMFGADFVSGVELDGHRFHVYGVSLNDPAPVRTTGEIGGNEGVRAAWRSLLTDDRSRKIERGFSGAAVWDTELEYFVGMVVSRERRDDGHRSFFSPSSELLRLWPRLERIVRSPFEISPQARDHWLPRARGVTSAAEDGWYFSGRDVAIDELTAAARNKGNATRYFSVIGRPGTGKSSLLARLPVIADPRLTLLARLSIDQIRLSDIEVIPIYLRQATADDFFAMLSQVVGVQFTSVDGFLDAIRQNRRLFRTEKLLVLDGLDEAADETARQHIARAIRRIAQSGGIVNLTVVVSCRSGIPGSENARLIEILGSRCKSIDVESTKYVQRSDFSNFVERRLLDETSDSPYIGRTEKVTTIAELVAARAYPNYLVAQLVTRALLDDPMLSEEQLEKRIFPSTVDEAFDEYLARFGDDEDRARHLMAGLAHARGAGFAAGDLWLTITEVVSGHKYDTEDLNWLLKSGAAFLIETSDSVGESRYRLYHQALVDMLEGGMASEVYDKCVLLAGTTTSNGDREYFREHLSGHALAAGRLSELLLSPEALLCCSAHAVIADSSRSDVILSEEARPARAAVRSVEHQLDTGNKEERRAYLALAGHQFGCDAITHHRRSGPWWVHAAVWQTSSDHVILSRGQPFTVVSYALIGEDRVAIAGDADGWVTFETLDGSGPARPPIQFPGSITHLTVDSGPTDTFLAIGTDAGEVHLVRISPDTRVRSLRVAKFQAPVAGIMLTTEGLRTTLVAASMDGSVRLDVRHGLRHIQSTSARIPKQIASLTGLRGGRTTAAIVTSHSEFLMIRTEDLTLIDGPPTEYDDPVFQIFDSWHEADAEASALFSSWSGIGRVGLEFGRIEPIIARESSSRFVCTSASPKPPYEFIISDGTSIVAYDSNGLEKVRLRGHSDAVIDLAVTASSKGPQVISASDDGTLRLWDLSTEDHGEDQRVAVEIVELFASPFKMKYRRNGVEFVALERDVATENSSDAPRHSHPRLLMSPPQQTETRLGDMYPSSRTLRARSVTDLPFWYPLDNDPWVEIEWEADEFIRVLLVGDSSIDVVNVGDGFGNIAYRAEPGISESIGHPRAVVGQKLGDEIYFFIADGSYMRVFSDELELIACIHVGGGPPQELHVSVSCEGPVPKAAFALRCESGLIAGEVILPG